MKSTSKIKRQPSRKDWLPFLINGLTIGIVAKMLLFVLFGDNEFFKKISCRNIAHSNKYVCTYDVTKFNLKERYTPCLNSLLIVRWGRYNHISRPLLK
ncbi:hypothetical protein C1T21_01775 [Paenibacillus sp. F4]|nr:hypothetical protein C1T21_01775 [Paenibacillus sp. F4]